MIGVGLKIHEQLVDKVGIERVDGVRCQMKPIEQHDIQIPLPRAYLFAVELAPPAMIEPALGVELVNVDARVG